mmetsp:Transcript_64766/g.146095  ORF Transcript_64766/g.146095 Transcript_64766/m.146095 type:complete len:202 (+) Transcript_64766:350-955(+)
MEHSKPAGWVEPLPHIVPEEVEVGDDKVVSPLAMVRLAQDLPVGKSVRIPCEYAAFFHPRHHHILGARKGRRRDGLYGAVIRALGLQYFSELPPVQFCAPRELGKRLLVASLVVWVPRVALESVPVDVLPENSPCDHTSVPRDHLRPEDLHPTLHKNAIVNELGHNVLWREVQIPSVVDRIVHRIEGNDACATWAAPRDTS